MNLKHTPGPWQQAAFTIQHSNGGEIATVTAFGDDDNEAHANAALIAAAPELLAALKAVIDDCLALDRIPISGKTYRECVAAIENAEGRQ